MTVAPKATSRMPCIPMTLSAGRVTIPGGKLLQICEAKNERNDEYHMHSILIYTRGEIECLLNSATDSWLGCVPVTTVGAGCKSARVHTRRCDRVLPANILSPLLEMESLKRKASAIERMPPLSGPRM
jgi:hypothetical protein